MFKIIAGVIVVVCIFILIKFPSPILSSVAYICLFLTAGVALSLEAKMILKSGEVKARIYKSTKDAIILRSVSPLRFYFYVSTYTLFAIFCFLSAAFALFASIRPHLA